MTGKLGIFELAAVYLREAGYEADVRAAYSGRNQFGKTCVAIVSDAPAAYVGGAIAKAAYTISSVEDALSAVPKRIDNMGMERVFY